MTGTTLTPEQREEIRKRAEAATPEKCAGGQRAEVSLTWAEKRLLDYAHADIPALLASIASAEERAEKAEAALQRDRSTVATEVTAMREAMERRQWLLDPGRGSYEWDDDRYRDEFRQALEEITTPIDRLRVIASDWANCPTSADKIKAARSTEAERDTLRARVAELEADAARLSTPPSQRRSRRMDRDELVHKVIERFGAVPVAAIDLVLEEAAKAQCDGCSKGMPINEYGYHEWDSYTVSCHARAIRALTSKGAHHG